MDTMTFDLSWFEGQMEMLASGAESDAPYMLSWQREEDEDGALYCNDCAERLYLALPDAEREEEGYFNASSVAESESAEWCEVCGMHLSVSLGGCGVEEELSHLESSAIETPTDGLCTLRILYADNLWNLCDSHEATRLRRLGSLWFLQCVAGLIAGLTSCVPNMAGATGGKKR